MSQNSTLPANVKRSLAVLDSVNVIEFRETVKPAEVLTNVELGNNFVVSANNGQINGTANEKINVFSTVVAPKKRQFEQDIILNQKHVFTLSRNFQIFSDYVEIKANKQVLSSLKYDFVRSLIGMRCFSISNFIGDVKYNVKGYSPMCCICGKNPWVYQVFDTNGKHVATVSKQWSGLFKEAFTDADNFKVEFLTDIPAEFKAAIISIVFVINIKFYSKTVKKKK